MSFFKGFLFALVFLVIGFLLSSTANAQENSGLPSNEGSSQTRNGSINSTSVQLTGVGVHIGSHHWPAEQWNNSNPGVYIAGRVNKPDSILAGEYVAGTFYNSERKQSVYIGRNFNLASHLDITVGAITGYHQSSILPLLAPSVFYDVAGSLVRLRLTVLPKVATMPWVVHLSVERRF